MAADPPSAEDWRLTEDNIDLFRGASLRRKRYKRWSASWDHDHCRFCWREFVEEGAPEHVAGTAHDGYTMSGPSDHPRPDYYWVCAVCFEELGPTLGMTATVDPSGT